MKTLRLDSFKSRGALKAGGKTYDVFRLEALSKKHDLKSLPFSLRIFLENLLRNEDGRLVKTADVSALADWAKTRGRKTDRETAFMPARVLMQDFTGVPAVVDLAAMRDAIKTLGGSPARISPLVPVDLVVDHSVQVDRYGTDAAFAFNARLEFERNQERYRFLKWGQKAFSNFSVVPPDTGIVHQVNLEHLARVVWSSEEDGRLLAYPDTLVGTDSHTTMINGLGVLGWGVGGIEAEAVMLGQPIAMLVPEVVGFKLTGRLPEGSTATDAVLAATQMLRQKGVVGKFVEFFGPGLGSLALADRATIANMAPEYGATMGYFPVDAQTLDYLAATGRPQELLRLVEEYCKAQGLWRTDSSEPAYTETLELDLGKVKASLAGPRRPQDRILLGDVKGAWAKELAGFLEKSKTPAAADSSAPVALGKETFELRHGSVVIAAITSCTNTSNPSVMLGAALLAKKAAEKGLKAKPWVKTSLAPGSKVVMDYLKDSGLLPYLERLNFFLVGYGCTTCIGNSGPLAEPVAEAVGKNGLVVAAVLSGNRNFEGRVHPQVRANYLASPPLVVAYALAGRMDLDLLKEPLGTGKDGKPVFLRDIWPSNEEVYSAVSKSVRKEMFQKQYASASEGDSAWKGMSVARSELYPWDARSTYIQNPPYFSGFDGKPRELSDIKGARVLAVFGDSVTTDHISPAGNIAKDSPAGKFLLSHGVEQKDFNSYGARRGNHEVMMRGTFANIRIKNLMLKGVEGGLTLHLPDGERMPIYDAAMKYREKGVPLIVVAGKEYGSGSSRDWAAKGPALLGVRAVIAAGYERIHRSNLLGMGVLPLQFKDGESSQTLGLTGHEVLEVSGIAGGLKPGQEARVKVSTADGRKSEFRVLVRIDTPAEVEYYRYGGILPFVLSQLAGSKEPAVA